jgi:hypothetical protein
MCVRISAASARGTDPAGLAVYAIALEHEAYGVRRQVAALHSGKAKAATSDTIDFKRPLFAQASNNLVNAVFSLAVSFY